MIFYSFQMDLGAAPSGFEGAGLRTLTTLAACGTAIPRCPLGVSSPMYSRPSVENFSSSLPLRYSANSAPLRYLFSYPKLSAVDCRLSTSS